MNEAPIFTFSYLGATGIGLVWGWWCFMRFSASKGKLLNRLIILVYTMGVIGMTYWQVGGLASLILLLAACGAAFFHYMWRQYLQKKYL